MTPNLEKFRPQLRPGRVIPRGSRIIFETDNPYNQIELPMVLADFILLCSGHFTVREILEKIYHKQGSVPFKSILKAIHLLHQGGFFENGQDLILSQNLQSWMRPRQNAWPLSWRFGKKILAANSSPKLFYLLTLGGLIASIFGFQYIPHQPWDIFSSWAARVDSSSTALWEILLWASVIQTVRYALCGVQLLLLTAKVYNVSLKISLWGLHLHFGDEANDFFENRLYTAMFHISQITCSWLVVWMAAQTGAAERLEPLIFLAAIHSFWEINPFRNSEGKKLFKDLILPKGEEVNSWHFDRQAVVNTLSPDDFRRDQLFSRLSSSWGTFWLSAAFAGLAHLGFAFGPAVLHSTLHPDSNFLVDVMALGLWLLSLYYVIQNLMRVTSLMVFKPSWIAIKSAYRYVSSRSLMNWQETRLKAAIEDLPLFSHFEEENLAKIISLSKIETFEDGVVIFDQGEVSQDLYFLLDGEVDVLQKMTVGDDFERLIRLNKGSIFGESALIDATPRAARVVASGFVTVMKTPVSVVRQAALESKAVRQLDVFRNAIMLNQYFVSSPAFRSLTEEAVSFLCSRGTFETFDAHHTVFKQGDEGDSLFLVLRGQIHVFVHKKLIKTLPQGSFFGEISLIADIPRTATMVTAQPCVLFKITAEAFWEVLIENMDLGVFIETISENRLREDLTLVMPSKTGTDF